MVKLNFPSVTFKNISEIILTFWFCAQEISCAAIYLETRDTFFHYTW